MTKRKSQYSDDFIALNHDMLAALESETPRTNRSKWEQMFAEQIEQCGLGHLLTSEYKFDTDRDYRFDWCCKDRMLGIEIDGGNHMAIISKRTGKPIAIGRHTQVEDYRKLNRAAELGYRVMRFTPEMVKSGEAIAVTNAEIIPF